MPENDPPRPAGPDRIEQTDPEIDALLRQSQAMSPDVQLRSWAQLQRYRAEALAAAHAALEGSEKLGRIEEARTSLKAKLRRVLATPEEHAGCAERYTGDKARIIREAVDASEEVRERAARVREEMIGHEAGLYVMDGFTTQAAEMAARNNLALRLKALDDELLTELARIQGVARQRLARLLEELEEDE